MCIPERWTRFPYTFDTKISEKLPMGDDSDSEIDTDADEEEEETETE